MNYPIILKMLSMVMLIMAAAFSACAGVSVFYGESPLEAGALPSWVCAVALSVMTAFALYVPSRNAKREMFRKEAMCIVGIAWILTSLVGALPYAMILNCSAAEAVFESTSGITTTGASVFSDFSQFPRSLMFWRCLSHWIGGLGVVVFFVAILSFLGASGKILYTNEKGSDSDDLEAARIKSGILGIIRLYVFLTACCLGLFLYFGMSKFDAVCHAFSVVSTGGFSTRPDSFAGYQSYGILWTAIVFMFLGGTNFPLLLTVAKLRFAKLRENTEFWTYVLMCLTATAVVWTTLLCVFPQRAPFETFTHGVFQVVSLITTTGLCSENYQTWIPAAKMTLLLLIVVGGCSGSTSGGLKISRAVAAFRICRRETEKSFRPKVVRNVFINGRVLKDSDAAEVLSYSVLYMLAAAGGMLVLTLLEPRMSMTGCISATLAMIGNVGPGFAEVGCDATYGFMSPFSQIVLSVLMIMGRLEIYAVLVLFMPSLWKKFQ